MEQKYNYTVFIGRFQPFHIGHQQVIENALSISDTVIIAIGSSYQARTPKNPWTYGERCEMISRALSDEVRNRVKFVAIRDHMYNDQQWVAGVQEAVHTIINCDGWRDKTTVALIGHKKDETSYYLDMFPQWTTVEHELNEEINATDLRELMFEGKNLKFLQSVVAPQTYQYLEHFSNKPIFESLSEEYNHIVKYKKSWDAAPYAPTFVTADAVVVQSGHVLLVRRRSAPGKGLLAVPGGFVNQNEGVVAAAIRELREETKLKVPEHVLLGSIKAREVFDAPNRSARGRTITHAVLIELQAERGVRKLPIVKGSDDAEKAFWMSLNDVKTNEELFFEDHFQIVMSLVTLLKSR